MKQIILTKVTNEEIQVMQEQIYKYSETLRWSLKTYDVEEFLNAITAIDLSYRLWYTFRKRVEGNQLRNTIRLKVSDAAVLLKCFMWPGEGRNEFEKNVALKYKGIIDHQLKSI